MLWWPKRDTVRGGDEPPAMMRWHVADVTDSRAINGNVGSGAGASEAVFARGGVGVRTDAEVIASVSIDRVGQMLDKLDVRFISDGEGSLLAMWERHAVLFAIEGPADEILVIRARPHATVPPDWAMRAFAVVNEWNHTRRFCKAYVGDPTVGGRLPIYAEVQVPLVSGVHDELLVELLECGVSVSECFVNWLHEEGALF